MAGGSLFFFAAGLCDNMRMASFFDDSQIRQGRELAVYRQLLSYCTVRHGLMTSAPWPSHPERTVLSHEKSGRWYAVGLMYEEAGRSRYALEILFDPSLIPLLSGNGYCAGAIVMDSRSWLRLVIDEAVRFATYTDLVDLGLAYAEKVYRDGVKEKGPVYADAMIPHHVREEVPAQILEMRKIRARNSFDPREAAAVFYRQAVLMKDYEDDFRFRGSFHSFRPLYSKMTDAQLRGYFSWRTAFREDGGYAENTPAAFLRLYVYELLHLIHGGKEETLAQLEEIEEIYGPLDEGFAADIKRWTDDFVIYYRLPEKCIARRFETEDLAYLHVLKAASDGEEADPDSLKKALKVISQKAFDRSAFLKQNEADALSLLAKAYRIMAAEYRREGMSLFKKKICMTAGMRYMMFESAVFFAGEVPADCTVEVSLSRIYHCRRGVWVRESNTILPFWNTVVKEADRVLRDMLGNKKKLKRKCDDPLVLAALKQASVLLRKEKQEAARTAVNIDMGALRTIRANAAETRDALLVEEAEDAVMETEEKPAGGNEEDALPGEETEEAGAVFSAGELAFLRDLLGQRDMRGYDSLNLLADEINEKMMDLIGDTVIEFSGETPYLVEDYIEDIKKMTGKGGGEI